MPSAPAPRPAASPGRVLIVDDSAVARAVIARHLEGSGRWVVAAAVPTVAAALAFLAGAAVEVLLLDVNLPGVDGLTALPDLVAAAPGARVVVMSADAAAGVQALALGAADALCKPDAAASTRRFGADLLAALARLGEPRAAAAPAPAAYDLVAIGASTGGIPALSGLLRAVPPAASVPIVVTQHLPASFMPFFAAQLAVLAGRPCDVATDRMRVRAGRVVVAPGDAHLHCVALGDGGTAVRLSRAPAATGCMPSVDPMLASLAPVHGGRLLAVVLSGMGRDGVDGARAVRAAGGRVVAQDSASSVVWGMPGAVVAAGLADAVLPPERIGALIAAGRPLERAER